MASNSPRKSSRKSSKSADFFVGVPLEQVRFLIAVICNVYIFICFCYDIPLRELRANILF
jgi:hypothetical protein